MQNISKWVHLGFLACGVLAWVFSREIFLLGFDPLGWNRMNWVVPPSDIAGIVTGAALFIYLLRSQQAAGFTGAAFAELAKVTWPDPKETGLSTGVVSVMLAIATLCILLFDTIWTWVAQALFYA